MKITIPDDYQNAVRNLSCFSKLAGHEVKIYHDSPSTTVGLIERFQDAEALVLTRERTRITEELVSQLPKLRLIAQTGGGTAHIDLAACESRGITVTAGTGSPIAPAELTWGLVLSAMRRIPAHVESLRAGIWRTTLGTNLHGRTLGIFGLGKIGQLVAGYARAFGMQVLVWGRDGSLSRARAEGYEVANSQADLFARADILSLHLRLTEQTRGIVTADDLMRMKTHALLVNTSRAELVAPGALLNALEAGRPGCAAVDVYEQEPTVDHPLLSLPNVICTPHIGYVERDHYELYFGTAFDQVISFANNEPIGVVQAMSAATS